MMFPRCYFYTFQCFKKLWFSAVTTWYKAKLSMEEHATLLREQGLPVPKVNPNQTIIIQNQEHAEAVA